MGVRPLGEKRRSRSPRCSRPGCRSKCIARPLGRNHARWRELIGRTMAFGPPPSVRSKGRSSSGRRITGVRGHVLFRESRSSTAQTPASLRPPGEYVKP